MAQAERDGAGSVHSTNSLIAVTVPARPSDERCDAVGKFATRRRATTPSSWVSPMCLGGAVTDLGWSYRGRRVRGPLDQCVMQAAGVRAHPRADVLAARQGTRTPQALRCAGRRGTRTPRCCVPAAREGSHTLERRLAQAHLNARGASDRHDVRSAPLQPARARRVTPRSRR